MDHRRFRSTIGRLLVLSLLCAGTACFRGGGLLKASADEFHITPLPAMVARKVDAPLYLVVNPAQVPDRFFVSGIKVAIFSVPDVDLRGVQLFVRRDLKSALEAYFSTVCVVDDESKVPATPHVRGQIVLTKVEYERRVSQGESVQKNELFGAVEWGFGLKATDQPDFAFRFAERTVSDQQMKSFDDTAEWESAFQEALRHMLAEYAKSGAQEKLLTISAAKVSGDAAPPTSPPAVATCPASAVPLNGTTSSALDAGSPSPGERDPAACKVAAEYDRRAAETSGPAKEQLQRMAAHKHADCESGAPAPQR
jgi:hypothetical protein